MTTSKPTPAALRAANFLLRTHGCTTGNCAHPDRTGCRPEVATFIDRELRTAEVEALVGAAGRYIDCDPEDAATCEDGLRSALAPFVEEPVTSVIASPPSDTKILDWIEKHWLGALTSFDERAYIKNEGLREAVIRVSSWTDPIDLPSTLEQQAVGLAKVARGGVAPKPIESAADWTRFPRPLGVEEPDDA